MDYPVVDHRRCTVIYLSGRLDGSVAPRLHEIFLHQLSREKHNSWSPFRVVLVLKDVSYTSAAALREFIVLYKACRLNNRGDMRLAEVNPHIRKVLDLTGLSGVFTICDTEADAVGSF